ncbi:N-acetylneuraminate synthase family protein [Azospirillum sp. Marseille-Q6669]
MRIGSFDTARRVLIVAEIGNNHEGNPAVAEELVDRAAESGAHAVKFQTFRTECFVSPVQSERFERMRRFELAPEVFVRLAERARKAGLLFLSTPLDLPSLAVLEPLVDAVKIASGDNTFVPLLRAAAATGKPMIVSTGLARLDEVAFAKALVESVWASRGADPGLALLHCVSSYPVPSGQENLAAVVTLSRRFGCTVGYSDHTLGIRAAVLAVAAGARIVEKHFTLDRNHSSFRDHQLSADPAMLRALVQDIAEAEAMLGTGVKEPQEDEAAAIGAIRRSIAAARPLAAGSVIGPDDIVWLRPGGGIEPGREDLVLGRRVRQDLPAGAIIAPDVLA